jgi:hypothetical protein
VRERAREDLVLGTAVRRGERLFLRARTRLSSYVIGGKVESSIFIIPFSSALGRVLLACHHIQ